MIDYSENIQKLFSLGVSGLVGDVVDYQELGLSSQNSDELVSVALDDTLHYGDNIDENHLYAPIHAINALSQINIKEPFDKIFDLISKYEDDDYLAYAIISYAKEIETIDSINLAISNSSLSTLAIDTLNSAIDRDTVESKEEKILQEIVEDTVEPKEEKILQEVEEDTIEPKEEKILQEVVEDTIEPKEEVATPVKIDKVELKKDISKPTIKVGRNEPCPCGSGKKYKKCCL